MGRARAQMSTTKDLVLAKECPYQTFHDDIVNNYLQHTHRQIIFHVG